MEKSEPGKSRFKAKALRILKKSEYELLQEIEEVVLGKHEQVILVLMPNFASFDNKIRPLIFSYEVAQKIVKDHGMFVFENLIITSHDWEYLIKNVDRREGKINLIKQIPNTSDYFTIGANRHNGFYVVTYYEKEAKNSKKLKNLLRNKGDALDRAGRAVYPSFATSSEEAASQPNLSGVRTDKERISN